MSSRSCSAPARQDLFSKCCYETPWSVEIGQDFNFTFIVGAGAKYNITDDFFARVGAEYQHISNAGLSDPIPNNAIDAFGPKLSFGYSF
jgi:opacity protein-like surface antigen